MALKAILFIGSNAVAGDRFRAFERASLGDEMQRVSNVNEALAYLNGLRDGKEDQALPAMVLVCPTVESEKTSELVSSMRSEQTLKNIPVVVLTPVSTASRQNPHKSASDPHFVPVNDTDALLDIVSKHLPDSNGHQALRHASLA